MPLCISASSPFLLPDKCTSISHCWASFSTECRRQTDTYWPSGLLFQLHLGHREALRFGGSGQCAFPKLEPGARQRGLVAPPLLREHQPCSRGPWARLEGMVWQTVRSCFRQGLYRERTARPGEAYHSPTFSFSVHCGWRYGGLIETENKSSWFHRKLLRSTL